MKYSDNRSETAKTIIITKRQLDYLLAMCKLKDREKHVRETKKTVKIKK